MYTEFATLESAIHNIKEYPDLRNSTTVAILRLVRDVLSAENYDEREQALDELESYCR